LVPEISHSEITIALTGASGYIGRVLTPLLIAEGHSLRLLLRSGNPPEGTQSVQGDLSSEDSLARLVLGADVVIHLAAMISVADRSDSLLMEVNVTGTRLLLEAARRAGVRRFIHLSSVTAFNQAPYEERMDESRGPAKAAGQHYEWSKTLSQAAALEYNGKGLEVLVIAPTAVTGPFDHRPSLIGQAIIDIYQGRLPVLFPGGVDFVDVRDVAGAIHASISAGVPGKVYLLAGRWVSLKTLSENVGRVSGKQKTIPVLPLWLILGALPLVKAWAKLTGRAPYYTRQAVNNLLYSNKKVDSTQAQTDLRFRSRPFEETLKDAITWFRQNGLLFS
jgi:dihydroflavonol-4-reductase